MRLSTDKKIAAIAVGAVAVAGTGAAYAYWTATGQGAGAATTGDVVPFTIVEAATTGDPLSPGGPEQTAAFRVHNPGSGHQGVAKVVVTVAGQGGAAWGTPSGCSAADFSLGGGAAGAAATVVVGQDLAPGADSTRLSVSVQMVNRERVQDACKGVTVPLHYAIS